ncbi:MAG: hypothetical protein ACFFDI_13650 [Promethearchaeota archaeon]
MRRIRIRKRANIRDYFAYLEEAPRDMRSLAEELLPWKFDCNLPKRKIYDDKIQFVDEDWLNTFLKLLERDGIKLEEHQAQLHHLFPWIYENFRGRFFYIVLLFPHCLFLDY